MTSAVSMPAVMTGSTGVATGTEVSGLSISIEEGRASATGVQVRAYSVPATSMALD